MLFRLFFLILPVFITSAIIAQKNPGAIIDDYLLQTLTDEDGLPQNSVKDFLLDESGFLWIATENGIVRYDGRSFRSFSSANMSITSNRFLFFIKPLKKSTNEFYAPNENSEILRICKNKVQKSNLTIDSLLPGNMLRYDVKPDRINWFNSVQNNFWKPSPKSVFVLPVTRKEYTAFYIDKDSIRFVNDNRQKWQISHQLEYFGNFFHINGDLYYADRRKGAQYWPPSGPKPVKITGDFNSNIPGKSLKIYNNNNAEQIFGYADKNIYLLTQAEPGTLYAKLLASDINPEAMNVSCILFDESRKRLFLGSFTKGLIILKKRYFSILREASGSKMDNVFYSQEVLDSNTVITPQGAILGFNPVSKQKIVRQVKTINPETVNDRYSMVTDLSDNLWMKNGDSLTLYRKTDQKIINKHLLPHPVSQITMGRDGTLWIGTTGGGLFHLSQVSGAIPLLFLEIDNSNISCIAQEDDNTLWIGTNKGLYQLSLQTRELVKVKQAGDIYIRSIHIPQPSEIWFTTYEYGFFLLEKGNLTQFPLDPGRHMTSSHCILEDSLGYFWITTNKGLFQIRKDDLLGYSRDKNPEKIWYQHYLSDDGFNSNEFNGGCQPCAVRLPNGFVSLPSIDGLVWFRPEEVKPAPPIGDLFFDSIEADGVAFSESDDMVSFPFVPGHLRLEIAIPYFGKQEEIQLQYALLSEAVTEEYGDVEWKHLGETEPATIHLFNIRPGNHTLVIRKINGFGAGNYTFRKLYLSVPQPWYLTWWAMLIFLATFVAAIFLILKTNNLYFKRKNHILENAVSARTSELTQLLRELELSRENLAKQSFIKEQIIASISHDIKTPLRFLIRLNERLFERLSSQENADSREICKASYETGKNLDSLLSNLLEYVKTNPLKTEEVTSKPIHLYTLVEEKISLFKSAFLHQRSETLVNNEVGRKWMVNSDYHLLGIIVQNLIDNSIKAASKGFVAVFVDKDSNSLVFHNTGYPMPAAICEWVNSKDLGLVNERRIGISPQNGIGLLIVKQIASLLGLILKVESSPDQGTFFYVKFPAGVTET